MAQVVRNYDPDGVLVNEYFVLNNKKEGTEIKHSFFDEAGFIDYYYEYVNFKFNGNNKIYYCGELIELEIISKSNIVKTIKKYENN